MNKMQNMADIFPKHQGGDVGMSKLNLVRDKELIIPRALFATTETTFNH